MPTNKRLITKRLVDSLAAEEAVYVVWDAKISGFGIKVQPSGRKSYVFKYRLGGGRLGRRREPMIGKHGDVTPDEARDIAKDWAAQVRIGGDPAEERRPADQPQRLTDLFQRFYETHSLTQKTERSAEEDEAMLRQHLGPRIGHLAIDALDRSTVEALHHAMKDKPFRANRVLALLSTIMNKAEIWGWRAPGTNPCKGVRRFPEPARERYLTRDELGRLLDALRGAEAGPLLLPDGTSALIDPYAIAAIRLLMLTGARMSEILSLEWAWVDLPRGRLSLPRSKTGKKTIALSEMACAVLRDVPRLEGNPYVIVGREPLTRRRDLKRPWRLLKAAAEIEDARLHDLRHTFASVAVSHGLSLDVIGDLLGHTDPSTTKRYAHLIDETRSDAMNQIGAILLDGDE